MISETAEYALRATVFLASNHPRPWPVWEISSATKVPASYLAKVLGALARAGVVTSQRGPRGGFVLARPAHDITLLEILQAADPWKEMLGCPLGLAEHRDRLCALHRRLHEAQDTIAHAFRSCTLGDLASASGDDDCPFPFNPASRSTSRPAAQPPQVRARRSTTARPKRPHRAGPVRKEEPSE